MKKLWYNHAFASAKQYELDPVQVGSVKQMEGYFVNIHRVCSQPRLPQAGPQAWERRDPPTIDQPLAIQSGRDANLAITSPTARMIRNGSLQNSLEALYQIAKDPSGKDSRAPRFVPRGEQDDYSVLQESGDQNKPFLTPKSFQETVLQFRNR